MSVRAWAQLLRISLAPTLVADLCAGVAIARGGPGGLELVARTSGVSLLLFAGGMALNGWVDRAEDAVAQPRRPIPSGAIAPAAALGFAVLALAAAPLVAWTLGGEQRGDAATWAAGLAAAIVLYHTPLKRNPLAG